MPKAMQKHLFYTFLIVFALTALVTLLGIMGLVTIGNFYLKGLYSAFLLQVAGSVVGIYRATNFFGDNGSQPTNLRSYTVRLVFEEEHAAEIYPGMSATYAIVSNNPGERPVHQECNILLDDMDMPYIRTGEIPENTDLVFFIVELDDETYSGSFSLETQVVSMVQGRISPYYIEE